jgi:large subunit ribosomal protein L9
MKIILTETIDRVGTAGSIINVKDGFARNYLIPKKFAILATDGNIKKIEAIKSVAQEKHNELVKQYKETAHKIAQLSANFKRRAEDTGHLFGSVSDNDIVHFLTENGLNVHKNHIQIEKAIKTVGEHTVKVSFMQDICAELKITVEKE